VSLNYVEKGQPAPVASKRGGKRGGKRGYPAATQQMLTERDWRVDAEEGTSKNVYSLMRCSSRLATSDLAASGIHTRRRSATNYCNSTKVTPVHN
jgi:hypothetical protein